MDYLMQYLLSLTGDETTGQWVIIALVAGAAFTFAIAIMLLFNGVFDPVRSRLFRETETSRLKAFSGNDIAKKLQPVSHLILPAKKEALSKTAARLAQAGYRSSNSALHYYGLRILLMVGLPLAVFVIVSLIPGVGTGYVIYGALMAGAIGFIGPSFVLDKKISKRKRAIKNGFPDALDLLVICTEAGLGLDAALQRVAKDMAISHSALADELTLVNAEMRAGVDRLKALKNLADRTGLEDIKGLVSTLAQSMRFGTSVAETLRIYSEEFRDKRMQSAEELAAKLGVKIIFPLAFCFFPGFFIVVLGPALIMLMDAFAQMGY